MAKSTSCVRRRGGLGLGLGLGIILALVALLASRTAAEPRLRFKAGATASHTALTDTPGLTLGGALALTRWAPLSSLTFAPQVELLFARRRAPAAVDEAGRASYALDFIELPVLLHSELTLGSRSLYALAGGYGSVLLQAQRTTAGGIVDHAEIARSLDIGLLAAGGFELGSLAGGELFVEVRWQRGRRALLRESGGKHEAVSVLLGYGLGAEPDDGSPRAQHRRLAVTGGLVATRLRAPERADSAYSAGYALGGAFSPARLGSRIALVPQLELAFVHRSMHEAGPADGALTLDSLDLSLLVRGELAVAGAAVYGAGGVYGSALLRAQRTRDGVITDIRDTVSAADAGWLVGAGIEGIKGIEMGATAGATLSVELRYQRGLRDLLPASPGDVTQQSVSLLLGITQGSERAPATGESAPARSEGTVTTESLESLESLSHHGPRLAALGPLPASPAFGFNADMTVLCLRGGKTLKRWRGQAMWNGPMPVRYRGVVGRDGIEWDPEGLDAGTLRVDIELDGTGGESLQAWMHPRTRTLVVIVRPRQLGTGAGPGQGPGSEVRRRSDSAPGLDPAGTSAGGIGSARAGRRGSGSGSSSSSKSRAGKPGGSPRGKPGGDTAEEGGVDGEFSRVTGEKFGAAHGAIGGEGERSDDGARGGGALLGFLGVPAALRPLVEVLMIAEGASPGKLAATWIRKKIGKKGVLAIRTALRREAMTHAEQRIRRAAMRLNKSKPFRRLTGAQQNRLLQSLEWTFQRQYFELIERGARQQIRTLRRTLGGKLSSATRATVQRDLAKGQKLLKAARVKPIAGRLPMNHRYAGKPYPPDKLPRAYRKRGLHFSQEGYPVFTPYARKLPTGKKSVKIELTGHQKLDERLANQAAGLSRRPKGYTWHHHQDGTTMQLVPSKLHEKVRHTGGRAHYKHRAGDESVYPR